MSETVTVSVQALMAGLEREGDLSSEGRLAVLEGLATLGLLPAVETERVVALQARVEACRQATHDERTRDALRLATFTALAARLATDHGLEERVYVRREAGEILRQFQYFVLHGKAVIGVLLAMDEGRVDQYFFQGAALASKLSEVESAVGHWERDDE